MSQVNVAGSTGTTGSSGSPGATRASGGGGTGFRRIAVVAPDSRIDVALPENIAVSDVYPEVLRLTRQSPPAGLPTGYHLVRADGRVLDANRSLAQQQVLDGEMLHLRPFADSLPPAVFDDVSDAVASTVTRDRHRWHDDLLRGAGLLGVAVLLALLAFVLWFADPLYHDMHGLPGVIAGTAGGLLTVLGGLRARIYRDRASAAALGLGGLPLVLIAGIGIVPPDAGAGPGRLQFLLGCVCVLVASVTLLVLAPDSDAPFVGATFAAAAGTLVTFGMISTEATPTQAAAVCSPVAIGILAFLPGLSTRFARLPIGYATPHAAADHEDERDPMAPGTTAGAATPDGSGGPGSGGPGQRVTDTVDTERIAAQVRRGHALLLGLIGGCAALVVGSAAVLGFSDLLWAQLLTLATGLAMLLRARLFRYTAQVACALVAGIAAVALLVVGLALNPPTDAVLALWQGDRGDLDVRTLWLSVVLLLGVAVLTAAALVVPRRGLSPFWGRCLDLGESLLLLSLLPLALAVLDIYSRARSMTG